MKKFSKEKIFWILIVILAIFRLFLTNKLTVIQLPNAVVDDAWVVFMAWNLKRGKWQGPYGGNTMIKGITSPLLLAISSSLGISYISIVTILYIASIILFIYSIKNLVKNKYMLFIIYVALLFNPILFGQEIIQRVYRNSFVPAFSLAIISMYIIIFLDEKNSNKNIIINSIILGIIFALFWNLREDSIWIIPYVVLLSIFIVIKRYKSNKRVFYNIAILFIPIAVTLIVNNIICMINYIYYGAYQRIDFASNSNFVKVCEYIEKIEYEDADDMNSVTIAKMKRLFEVSPTLNKNSENILKHMKGYDKLDTNPNDEKIANGWFGWCIKSAMSESKKYEDFEMINQCYENIYQELEEATKLGKIKIKNGFYNTKEIINKFLNSIKNSIYYVINFDNINSNLGITSEYEMNFVKNMYEEIALNKMIYSEEDIEIYKVANLEEQNNYLQKYSSLEKVLNGITKCYQKSNYIIFILGFFGYLVITYNFIFKKKRELIEIWAILSGLIGSAFTIVCGVSYINITACNAINYFYLVGTYSLIIAFEFIGIYYLIVNIKNILKRKKVNERT